uniref:Isocitrate dehydrogenase [NAD] subunit, mitochondrial n=1 Tax=Strigamia maritima TaxID=126957 RepID=T1IIV4_STRMM
MKPLAYIAFKLARLFGYHSKKKNDKKSSGSDTDILLSHGCIVGKKIGEGAYGNVRIAKQLVIGAKSSKSKIVAVKIVNRRKLSQEFKENFFHRELQILRKLNHKNVIRVYDIIDVHKKVYIIMKYARNGDLCNYVHDYGPLHEIKATLWFQQIVFGLFYCHERGIAHRDLKSDNILIMNSNHVVITDFGLACFCQHSNSKADFSSGLSDTYCGSPAYVAPEIISCEPYDPKLADVWSLGIVLYFMLSAGLPFDNTNLKIKLVQQQKRDFTFDPNLKLARHCEKLLLQMLEPIPGKRISLSKIRRLKWLIQRTIENFSTHEHNSSLVMSRKGLFMLYFKVFWFYASIEICAMIMAQGGFGKITSNVLKQTVIVHSKNFHTTFFFGAKPIQEPVSKPKGQIICTLVPGDGVGPEMANSVQEIFRAAKVPIKFEFLNLSEIQPETSVQLQEVLDSVARNGVCLKGILINPSVGEAQSFNMKLRRQLDLFANVVHIKSLPGVKTRHTNVDFIVIRESIEGEYSFLEHEGVDGIVESLKIVTRYNSRRIAKFAFDYATKLGRKKVTAVHKANIMKLGDGLFLNTCGDISKLYPSIKFDNMIIDNCTMQLASNPHQFDVLVMPNLYGDIINNLGAGLVGGAGVVAGGSYSQDYVMFEPGTRHVYNVAVGKNLANPTAMILCASKMLKHVNLSFHGKQIEESVFAVLKTGKVLTKDMGGNATSTEYTRAIIENLK